MLVLTSAAHHFALGLSGLKGFGPAAASAGLLPRRPASTAGSRGSLAAGRLARGSVSRPPGPAPPSAEHPVPCVGCGVGLGRPPPSLKLGGGQPGPRTRRRLACPGSARRAPLRGPRLYLGACRDPPPGCISSSFALLCCAAPGPAGPAGVNDPSAGSPTETLLRLLLPLNRQVWTSFRLVRAGPPPAAGAGRAGPSPRPPVRRPH